MLKGQVASVFLQMVNVIDMLYNLNKTYYWGGNIVFALNFISPHNEMLLTARQKTATIRPGDLRDTYPERMIVWVTFGAKYGPKRKLYQAIIDRVLVKKFSDITKADLAHQNPELKSVEELMQLFEGIYETTLNIDDLATIIHFSEVQE